MPSELANSSPTPNWFASGVWGILGLEEEFCIFKDRLPSVDTGLEESSSVFSHALPTKTGLHWFSVGPRRYSVGSSVPRLVCDRRPVSWPLCAPVPAGEAMPGDLALALAVLGALPKFHP